MTRTGGGGGTMNYPTAAAAAVAPPAAAAASGQQHSPWHSPVPYLFGGLAAMLGLIAFALLILACSYWKLSGYLEGDDTAGNARDAEAGGGDGVKRAVPMEFEEKILVIMAGDVKPTYLATPMSSRASSFGERNSETMREKSEAKVAVAGLTTKVDDQGSENQVEIGNPQSPT